MEPIAASFSWRIYVAMIALFASLSLSASARVIVLTTVSGSSATMR